MEEARGIQCPREQPGRTPAPLPQLLTRWYEANRQEHKARAAVRSKAVNVENRLRMRQHLQTHPCVECGEADLRVLDFDHRPGVVKQAEVGRLLMNGFSWATIGTEIMKCDVSLRQLP